LQRASQLERDRCPCGCRVFEVALGDHANFARLQCGSCSRRLGFARENPVKAIEWAMHLRLKSGPNAGRTLRQLAETETGRALLPWLIERAVPDLKRAARVVLNHLAGSR
jgi:hypothetical protein